MKRTELRRKTALRAGANVMTNRIALKRSGRLRQSRSTGKPTAEQSARWVTMRSIGCVACLLGGINYGQVKVPDSGHVLSAGALEIHHLTSGGRRIGHDATVCLCHYHHQGKRLPFHTHGYAEQAQMFGPSFGRGRATFTTHYGSDAYLLACQNRLLERRAEQCVR